MLSNQFYIYIYLNPLKPGKFTYGNRMSFSYEPFYIGKGSGKRLLKHLKETLNNTSNKFKIRIINKIKKNSLEPIIIKLNINLTNEQSTDLEKFYIKIIGRRDLKLGPLSNLTDGGEGTDGFTHSVESKLKMSKAKKGKKQTKEHIKKKSEALAGGSNKGRKGKPPWNKGLKGVQECSDETRRKMSLTRKGRTSPLKGIPRTEKAKIAMKEAWKKKKGLIN